MFFKQRVYFDFALWCFAGHIFLWAGLEAPRWQDAAAKPLSHVLSWACGSSRRLQDGGREPHGGSWWICFEFLICFDSF